MNHVIFTALGILSSFAYKSYMIFLGMTFTRLKNGCYTIISKWSNLKKNPTDLMYKCDFLLPKQEASEKSMLLQKWKNGCR